MSFRLTSPETSSSALDESDFTSVRPGATTGTVSESGTGSVWSLSAVAVLSIAPAVTSAAVTT